MTARASGLTVPDFRKPEAWTMRGVVTAALALPVIYSLIIPLAVLDFWVSLYQALCFGLLGMTPWRDDITSSWIVTEPSCQTSRAEWRTCALSTRPRRCASFITASI